MAKDCYDNRELSWLKFNARVLEEACDSGVPLWERLNFSAIYGSNLDEFFMIRVGSICDQLLLDDNFRENKTLLTCKEQLDRIFTRVKELSPQKDAAYFQVIKELSVLNIMQVDFKVLSKKEEEYLKVYFDREIRPLISPLILDKHHPFPFLKNKGIYAAAYLETKSGVKLGVIPASGVFERLIFLPTEHIRFMLVEDLILHYMPLVFEKNRIINKSLMRITRNADINAEEALYDHDVDFRDAMADLIQRRKKLSPVRLELSRELSKPALDFLCEKLELREWQIIRSNAPLDMSFVYPLGDKLARNELLFFPKLIPQRSPSVSEHESMAAQIMRGDILLCYPYEAIKPFIRLLNEASADKSVISVKITLYRVARNSKIIEALIALAEAGKDVLVLVELRARFDEENNIGWSKRLEEAGCTVIYGLEGLKVHSKLLLITRKLNGKIEYITQVGTGNYNEKTSTLYTDISLMTASSAIGAEAGEVFNALSMGTCVEETSQLLVAPRCLQNKIIDMLDVEIGLAKSGQRAYFGAKLNSLTDKALIDKLIEASVAGVRIELIVRGICCLVAGVKGLTDNITIISIVGRFLEHSRIYIFGTAERQKIYISSADFMTRNTLRRVEVAAPILDKKVAAKLIEMFSIMLHDNVKARLQMPDGSYARIQSDGEKLNSQEYFYRQAYEKAEAFNDKPVKVKRPILTQIKKLLNKNSKKQ